MFYLHKKDNQGGDKKTHKEPGQNSECFRPTLVFNSQHVVFQYLTRRYPELHRKRKVQRIQKEILDPVQSSLAKVLRTRAQGTS